MSNFTPEQLAELEARYGLKQVEETLPVRDGVVTKKTMVWWRGVSGPKHVEAGKDWWNIKHFPDVYQLAEPTVRTQYVD